MKNISLFAHAPGDPSVGIQSSSWSVSDLGDLDDYEGQREDVRKAFADAFELIVGEKVRVTFSDEFSAD